MNAIPDILDVLLSFSKCSTEIREGVLEMVQIATDPDADDDEKAAASDTIIDALRPTREAESPK